MEVLIISEELFKENSPVGINVNLEDWQPYILLAQKMYIRKVLGRPLLIELQAQIKAAGDAGEGAPNPITPENRALLIEIAPALAYYAMYLGLPFQWAKIQNKGITAQESENSKALDFTDVSKLQRGVLEHGETFAHELIGYLCGCAAKYPLWSPYPGYGCSDRGYTCCDGSAPKYGKPYESGVFFPKRRGSCKY